MAQRRTIGAVVEIPLENGRFGYGRILKLPLMAFYDLQEHTRPGIERIVRARIAFKIWVMKYAVTKGHFRIIGKVPLTEDLQVIPSFYRVDLISGQLEITNDEGFTWIPATLEDIRGMECAAVWDPEHVIGRLNDHFAGRPCRIVQSFLPDGLKHAV